MKDFQEFLDSLDGEDYMATVVEDLNYITSKQSPPDTKSLIALIFATSTRVLERYHDWLCNNENAL